VLNFLADAAVLIGTFCANRAARFKAKQDAWVDRGRFWSDVAAWFRLRCVKDLAEIRSERKAAKS
jgi:hypothetical protein